MGYGKPMTESVPEETARVAGKVYRKGNVYMRMRDALGTLYRAEDFRELFSYRGQPAESPGLLALVTVMQYAEGLSDRQAADAVRSRIDWKYALGLELTDPGFDYSVLSEFRGRLLAGGAELRLLDDMLACFGEAGLLSRRGTARTDSTHVLAAVRELNRLELVGETLRHALEVLAQANGEWLLGVVTPDWFDRYGERFDDYRLPKETAAREALAVTIGRDGYHLLDALYRDPDAPKGIVPIETLRQVWLQQFWIDQGEVKWRAVENLPPAARQIQSPFDLTARYSQKRTTQWVGYKAHLTETCGDPETPNLITHVQTTLATTPDVAVIDTIHAGLAADGRLPEAHLVDQGYVDAGNLVASQNRGVDLIGPVPADTSWQTRDPAAYDLSQFAIDWDRRQATCPEGKVSQGWSETHDRFNNAVINVVFSAHDCSPCPARAHCTRATRAPRSLRLRPQPEYAALGQARERQTTQLFRDQYRPRAGVEGTISQAVRSFDLRHSRYIGLPKTHLHNICVAAALNFTRAASWLAQTPRAKTRQTHFKSLQPVLCT